MSTIAVIVTDMFDDVEYTKSTEAFRKAGHTLIHIGLKKRATIYGKKQKI
jgi:protease I